MDESKRRFVDAKDFYYDRETGNHFARIKYGDNTESLVSVNALDNHDGRYEIVDTRWHVGLERPLSRADEIRAADKLGFARK